MITIFGGGAVGIALAVQLARAGRAVSLVRLRQTGGTPFRAMLRHHDACVEVPTTTLDRWQPEGEELLVVTAKAFANGAIAEVLAAHRVEAPVCLLQNGLNIEQPFLRFPHLCRGVLYVTGEAVADGVSTLKAVKPSVVGPVQGEGVERCVELLSTPAIPFAACHRIEEEVWKKGIVNAVFNSICTLLESDNGIFARCPRAFQLAREVVAEGVQVARARGLPLDEGAVLETVLQISRSSRDLISTLQDLRSGRPTEIEFLNLAIHELAQQLSPPVVVPRTRLLGELVLLKSRERNGHGTVHSG